MEEMLAWLRGQEACSSFTSQQKIIDEIETLGSTIAAAEIPLITLLQSRAKKWLE